MNENIKAALAVIEEAKVDVAQAREVAKFVQFMALSDDSISKEIDMYFVGGLLLNLLNLAFERIDDAIWNVEHGPNADNGEDKEGGNGK